MGACVLILPFIVSACGGPSVGQPVEGEGEVREREARSVPAPSAGAVTERVSEAASGETTAVLVLDLGGGVTMRLARVPKGSFQRGEGTSTVEEVRFARAFYMGVTEVTQAQYRAVMGKNPSHFQGPELPVDQVSWIDAARFCETLSRKSARKVHLPSEAEWEYACRAGTTTPAFFGNDEAKLGEFAWFEENGESRPHPVGQKAANPWGLHDMYGNVWEWCADVWYHNYRGIPPDGSPRLADAPWFRPRRPEPRSRPLRGGCWKLDGSYCRSAKRVSPYEDRADPDVGFRVAVSM